MILLLGAFALGAVVIPFLARSFGRWVFVAAAVVPAAAFVQAAVATSAILAGQPLDEVVPWVPQLGLQLALRMDALSWMLALVVSGVGTLVLLYCARYFSAGEAHLGRFAATLLAFAGSMYGLVLADDVFLLFVFWEATTVFSYLLIGHNSASRSSRGAALQALLVTTLGGLVMLVGLVLLSVDAATTRLGAVVEHATGDGQSALVTTALFLVLVGALSKSAIAPFHFWLPGAMAAPTPVSAYLHAAAMVKAGIYLLARFAPVAPDTPGWRETLVVLGVTTMLLGGVAALRQRDIKLLLAHGTVSQLGFLTVILGIGGEKAALAGLALLLAHAVFKSTLFLVVGIVDHEAGTRDLAALSGVGRRAPVLATTAALALASMVGLPPLVGFVAKEAVFGALITIGESGDGLGWFALAGVVTGSALTAAYSARFFWGAFLRKPGVPTSAFETPSPLFLTPPIVLALTGVALGFAAPLLDVALSPYPSTLEPLREPYHLALWHGFEPALGLSVATLVAGAAVFWAWGRAPRLRPPLLAGTPLASRVTAENGYWLSLRLLDRAAATTTGLTQRGSLPFYLSVILVVLVVVGGAALALPREWAPNLRLWDAPSQLAAGVLIAAAAIATTRATKRFQAAILVGVTGLGMAALFALQGAPDLALTQVLVEIVTLVAFVLVLRRLPARLGNRNGSVHGALRAGLGIAVGLLMITVAVVASSARTALPISLDWPELAYEQGHGRNVVNVALVDLRGWDTLGELSVVIAAATGVASLVFLSGRANNLARVSRRAARRDLAQRRGADEHPDTDDSSRSSWLLAGRTLAPRNRSILLEVVVRLLFHALVVLSLYLLLAGHNAPGGGFAGGLVVGLALVARYLAGGRVELGAAAPVDAGRVLGAGLAIASLTALIPLFFGADALTSTWVELDLGPFGMLDIVTSTFFDIGVYLVVIGLVLDVLRSLGAEVDEQRDAGRLAPAPEDSTQKESAS